MKTYKPALKVTNFDPKTLTWWKTQKQRIDMEPPYQRRGRLWSPTDKAYLIDSMLNGFDVPKFYIADFTYSDSSLNKKQLPYAIIDGKQRFEAIFDFFNNSITLNSDFTYLENTNLKLGGLGYRDLKQNYPDIIEVFDNFNISVVSIITDSEDLINELFVRLNRSKPLTGAEIRNAMAGPAPKVIREIAHHSFFQDSISFPITRGQDLNSAAKIVLFEFSEKPQETKKKSLDGFVKDAAKDRRQLELAARRSYSTLDDLSEIFLPKDRLLSSAGLIPVYYWFIKNINPQKYPYVREFLIKFEEERKKNRLNASADAQNRRVDRRLIEYDQYNRSTNDISSHVGRIEILEERFKKYLK